MTTNTARCVVVTTDRTTGRVLHVYGPLMNEAHALALVARLPQSSASEHAVHPLDDNI